MNTLQNLPISKIVDETPFVKTFYFPASQKLAGSASGGSYSFNSKPGQFVMLWIPGLDQKPFSVAYDDGEIFGLTIFNRGPLTKALFEKKVGDRVGVSGPFGTSFSIKPNTHYIMVAGGYGAAPLAYLAEEVIKLGAMVDFCVGARNKENLLFEERLQNLSGITLHTATDDGSSGHKGFVTDVFVDLLNDSETTPGLLAGPSLKGGVKRFAPSPFKGRAGRGLDDHFATTTLVATCGPELMEKKILDICNEKNVDCEISIERYMKCGVGVCGQCCVDPLGIRMCQEGPVVSKALVNKISEFGKYYRDKSGTKVYFR